MDTYIIRVYRLQKDNPRNLVGMVESVRDNRREKMAFTNVDDLWEILNSQASAAFFSKQRKVRQCRPDLGEKKTDIKGAQKS